MQVPEITIVNSNFRGSFKRSYCLEDVATCVVNSRLCTHPRQLIIKDEECTILLFPSGKFRVMGCCDEMEAALLLYKYAAYFTYELPETSLQSMSFKIDFKTPVNLYKLSNLVRSRLELELFSGLMIDHYLPVSVNVFANGKMMVMGVRDKDIIHKIVSELAPLLPHCTYTQSL